jgi:hypothetical protein
LIVAIARGMDGDVLNVMLLLLLLLLLNVIRWGRCSSKRALDMARKEKKNLRKLTVVSNLSRATVNFKLL